MIPGFWGIFGSERNPVNGSEVPCFPVETIAVETSIWELSRLEKQYGSGRWRKMKGEAMIRLNDSRVVRAEIHWYEAHGIGRKEFKRKRYLD